MASTLTQKEVEERCSANGYRWPVGFVYKTARTKYPLICLTCGDDTPKKFADVGRAGCNKCKYVAQCLTHDEAVTQGLAAEHSAQLLEPYKGCMVKHKYRFIDCGHEWQTKPNDLDNGSGCGVCYHDQGSTYVYLMEHDGFNAFKIGVTAVEHGNPWDSRIREFGRRGWKLFHNVRYDTRAEALAIEKIIVDSWRDQYFPIALTSEQIKTGYGETVSRMYVSPTEIVEMMDDALQLV